MLERYRDNERVPELRAVIEAHINVCDWCRRELTRMQGEPPAVPVCSALPEPEPPGMQSLLTRLRDWDARRTAADAPGPTIRQRVAREVGFFLGGRAAEEVVRPVADDAGNLLPSIQPLLGRFLGRKAASHLSTHIVDVALVRR
jgi:hypothetical protein